MLVKARNLLDTIRVRIRIPPAFGKRGSARHDSEIRELRRLSEQQAALRRVATTLARGSSPDEVFAQVAEEVGLLLGVEMAAIHRFDPGGWSTLVGTWGRVTEVFPVGTRFALDAGVVTLQVHRTHRPVRVESYDHMPGPLAAEARRLGVRSAVGSPIVVNGRLWGALAAATFRADTTLADAEAQITEFSELVASAISNVQARSDLAASRARIVAAADDERRRVVRDLHDGAQQRLVHTIVTLKLARRAFDQGRPEAAALVGEALRHAETANDELRELAHGILPKVLTDGGLGAGVEALASRMEIPVARDVPVSRLPPPVEATAYFIVAEALTNVAKHAHAHHATVRAHLEDHTLRVEVRDDGIGGARADGTGLVGLGDRLAPPEQSLLLPTVTHGYTPHHMDFPGSITIEWKRFVEYLVDIGKSLIHHGFRRILFVNGHGSNVPLVDMAARLLMLEQRDVIAATFWYLSTPVRFFPDYLSYFNELVGGPRHGIEYLDDSNVEWGHQLKRIKRYLDEHLPTTTPS